MRARFKYLPISFTIDEIEVICDALNDRSIKLRRLRKHPSKSPPMIATDGLFNMFLTCKQVINLEGPYSSLSSLRHRDYNRDHEYLISHNIPDHCVYHDDECIFYFIRPQLTQLRLAISLYMEKLEKLPIYSIQRGYSGDFNDTPYMHKTWYYERIIKDIHTLSRARDRGFHNWNINNQEGYINASILCEKLDRAPTHKEIEHMYCYDYTRDPNIKKMNQVYQDDFNTWCEQIETHKDSRAMSLNTNFIPKLNSDSQIIHKKLSNMGLNHYNDYLIKPGPTKPSYAGHKLWYRIPQIVFYDKVSEAMVELSNMFD